MSDPLRALEQVSGQSVDSAASALPSIPAVPLSDDQSVTNFLASVKLWLEKASSAGLTGFASKQDLVNAGILTTTDGGGLVVSKPANSLIPPKPTGLNPTGAASVVILEWDDPNGKYGNHAYTEIWAADADNFSVASMVGQSSGFMFGHSVGDTATRYYWIRFVSTSGIKGPFDSVNGAGTSTAVDPDAIFAAIVGSDIDRPFFEIAVPTLINGVTVPAGTYIKEAFIADATISRAKIRDLAVDSAKIADLAVVNAKINDLNASKINAGYLSADRIAANSIVAGKIDSRGLSIKDASGNVILASGSALDPAYAAAGTLNSDLTTNIAAAAATAVWSNVSGVGKPADNATVGATFGTNISGQITAANVSTYIESAAIGTAYIANAAITAAKIGLAEVGTLKLQGESVTVPRTLSSTWGGRLDFPTTDYGTGKVVIVCKFGCDSQSVPGIKLYRNGGAPIATFAMDISTLYTYDNGTGGTDWSKTHMACLVIETTGTGSDQFTLRAYTGSDYDLQRPAQMSALILGAKR